MNRSPFLLFVLFALAGSASLRAEPIDLAIADALAAEDRRAEDRRDDPFRRPDVVLGFFGIRPGMTVLDLFSGGGYYTEILSRLVGDGGTVYAHNNGAYVKYEEKKLEERFAGGRLANVQRVLAEANELELPPAHFDAALAMLTWHDFYLVDESIGWPAIDAAALIETLCAALKPGAVLGVSDHVALAGSDPRDTAQRLHRIDPQRIRRDLEGSCFEFEGEIDALRNPADDIAQPMSAPGLRGRTDRVVYRFRRR